jgi:hypothetical protein
MISFEREFEEDFPRPEAVLLTRDRGETRF